MENKTIMQIVKGILEVDDRARNDDKWLILMTLRELGFKIYIDYHELNSMPSFETITRIRRKLNEQEKYLPNQNTIEKRKEKSIEFAQEFSREYKQESPISQTF